MDWARLPNLEGLRKDVDYGTMGGAEGKDMMR